MQVHFPNSAFLGNIDAFVRKISTSNQETLTVTFNEKWMSIHPLVISMTAALALSVKEREGKIQAGKITAASGHYLKVMGLTEILGAETIEVTEHESAGRYIRISVIKDSKQLSEFITHMVPLLHMSKEQAEPIEYIMSELIRNVLEHARSPVGAIVCAQYFKKSNRVSIGVADLGVGVKSTINQSYLAETDAKALALALTPGITGTTNLPGGTPTNAGAGLFFIRSIAKVNRDFFVIYSGSAMYKLLRESSKKTIVLKSNPLDEKCTVVENLPEWHGTAVGIDITLTGNQDFDSLLTLIRKAYRSEVREKKKQRYKRPRFI